MTRRADSTNVGERTADGISENLNVLKKSLKRFCERRVFRELPRFQNPLDQCFGRKKFSFLRWIRRF